LNFPPSDRPGIQRRIGFALGIYQCPELAEGVEEVGFYAGFRVRIS